MKATFTDETIYTLNFVHMYKRTDQHGESIRVEDKNRVRIFGIDNDSQNKAVATFIKWATE